MAEKIKFGLSQVHYALLTDEKTLTYGEPVHIPGAVTLALSPEGDKGNFYADNRDYFTTFVNNGFSGDLEMALIPDDFKLAVLGYEKDATTGLLLEVANAIAKPIALLFQFETDVTATKVVFFKVNVSRPGIDHATKTETIEPQTDTITISVSPISKGEKTYTKGTAKTEDPSYETFYTNVPVPGVAPTEPATGE